MTSWEQVPLRAKLSVITTVLLIGALTITSGAAVMLLHSSLTTQLDTQLTDAAEPMLNSVLMPWEDPSPIRPTDYFIEIWDTSGTPVGQSHPTTVNGAIPVLPDYATVAALSHGDLFATLESTNSSVTRWRVGAFPIVPRGQSAEIGTALVALPMSAVDKTMATMRKTVVGVSALVVLLTGILGSLAVEHALRGLRRMERTVRAVTAGDLSERVRVDAPLTEVGHLGTSFNVMVAALEEAFHAREQAGERMRQFLADASHELRTPLASIRGYGELYRMGAVPDEEVPATMARIESEARRMGTLVTDLLALARMDDDRDLTLAEVDLRKLAEDTLADLGALAPDRPAQLIAPEPVLATVDGNKIRQVMMNLVGNTVQHTPAGTPVEIAVHHGPGEGGAGEAGENTASGDTTGGVAVIEIRDHGAGIAETDVQKVFERFYRPDYSRARSSGGSGLGLAIVATIVLAHHGTVRPEPTPGGGTTMIVTLPLAQPCAPGKPEMPIS